MRFWQKLGIFDINKLTLFCSSRVSCRTSGIYECRWVIVVWLSKFWFYLDFSHAIYLSMAVKSFSSRTICLLALKHHKADGPYKYTHRAKWIGMRSILFSLIETSERGGAVVTGRTTQTCDKWLRRIPGDSRHRRSDSSPNNHPLTMSSFGRARTCPLTFAGNWKS